MFYYYTVSLDLLRVVAEDLSNTRIMATRSKVTQNGNGSTEIRTSFPKQPQFSGFMKPCHFQREVNHLEVHGIIPPELDGTFYRVLPDPQLPPMREDDPVGWSRFLQ